MSCRSVTFAGVAVYNVPCWKGFATRGPQLEWGCCPHIRSCRAAPLNRIDTIISIDRRLRCVAFEANEKRSPERDCRWLNGCRSRIAVGSGRCLLGFALLELRAPLALSGPFGRHHQVRSCGRPIDELFKVLVCRSVGEIRRSYFD